MGSIGSWAAGQPEPEFKNNLLKKPNRIYQEFKHLVWTQKALW